MLHNLDIVIVNWNAGDQLRKCLVSLVGAAQEGVALRRVIVVDNNSSDGSTEGIDALPLPLHIIRNNENRGFAAACNQGAKGSDAEYLLFLNPDTVLSARSLADPIAFMGESQHAEIGIVGIKLFKEDNSVWRSCERFRSPWLLTWKMLGVADLLPGIVPSYTMSEREHKTSKAVDHVTGAFYFVRRRLFESLGGFDEQFFVYFEDVDFSLRTHLAGWKTYYLASVSAFHKGGGVSEKVKATRMFYSLRSRIIYACKHFKPLPAAVVVAGTLFVEPIVRLLKAMISTSWSQIVETFGGYWMLWASVPAIIRSTKR